MVYPYYIIITYEGRLSVPPEYMGTVLAKQFKSGKIGGSRQVEQQHTNLQIALQNWRRARLSDSRTEFYVVEKPNQPRKRLHNPEREVSR